MSIDALLDINRAALNFERARMEAASLNIAGANSPLSPGQAAQRHVATTSFAQQLGQPAGVSTESAATRTVHDPSHPLADADGNVHFPEVNLVQQMTELMAASRGYEANVRAVNMLRNMLLKSLEIGRS